MQTLKRVLSVDRVRRPSSVDPAPASSTPSSNLDALLPAAIVRSSASKHRNCSYCSPTIYQLLHFKIINWVLLAEECSTGDLLISKNMPRNWRELVCGRTLSSHELVEVQVCSSLAEMKIISQWGPNVYWYLNWMDSGPTTLLWKFAHKLNTVVLFPLPLRRLVACGVCWTVELHPGRTTQLHSTPLRW